MVNLSSTSRTGSGDSRVARDSANALACSAAVPGRPDRPVGNPTMTSMAPCSLARAFAEALATRLAPLPVRLVDERFTTVIAHDALRQGGRGSRQRRTQVDKAAAALILQGALDAERSTGEPAGELVASAPGAGG